jgi:pimeloyl-ACP methyl ester carboxylesterase
MVTPVGTLLSSVMKPSPKLVIRNMASFGENETIVRYPKLIEALVLAGHDEVASRTGMTELRDIISPLGFRASVRIQSDELQRVSVPTLIVWGRTDPWEEPISPRRQPLRSPTPDSNYPPPGNGPWLGHPNVAELVSGFVK